MVYAMPGDTLTIREGTLEIQNDSASISIQSPSYAAHYFRFSIDTELDSMFLTDSIRTQLKIDFQNESMTWKGYRLFGQRNFSLSDKLHGLDEIIWSRLPSTQPFSVESFKNRRAALIPADTLLKNAAHVVIGHKGDSIRILSTNELNDSVTTANWNANLRHIRSQGEYHFYADFRNGTPAWQLRFHKIPYDNYPSESYDGPLAAPDFKRFPHSLPFKTQIVEACERGINFSGKYTLVKWGCGSPCQMGVIVNRKTGEISDFINSELGLEFKENSSLLTRNIGALDTLTNTMDECFYCTVEQLNWTGHSFDTLRFNFNRTGKVTQIVEVSAPTIIAIGLSNQDVHNLQTYYSEESFYILADDAMYYDFLLSEKADSVGIEVKNAIGPYVLIRTPIGEKHFQSSWLPSIHTYLYWDGISLREGDVFEIEEWIEK